MKMVSLPCLVTLDACIMVQMALLSGNGFSGTTPITFNTSMTLRGKVSISHLVREGYNNQCKIP